MIERPLTPYFNISCIGDLTKNGVIRIYEIHGGSKTAEGPLNVQMYLFRLDQSDKQYVDLVLRDVENDAQIIGVYGVLRQGQTSISNKAGLDLFVSYQILEGVTNPSVTQDIRDNVQGQDLYVTRVVITMLGDPSEIETPVTLLTRIHMDKNGHPRTFVAVYPNIGDPTPEINT